MIQTTKAQRQSIKRLFYRTEYMPKNLHNYREFRKTVQRGYDNCLMVPFAGMWVGIETDGYSHT